MLVCPRCQGRLTRISTAEGVMHHCTSCTGRAVTFSSLRKSTSPDFMRRVWHGAAQFHIGKMGRQCPYCSQPMHLVNVPGAGDEIELDVCPACQIVWFDHSEHESAMDADNPNSDYSRTMQQRREFSDWRGRDNTGDDAALPQGWQWLPAMLGLPVELASPSLLRKPFVTWGIAIACAIVYFVIAGGNLAAEINRWGFIPSQSMRDSGATMLTSFFLHAGILHLVFNMYFLLIFGDNVEDDLGPLRFVGLLLAAHLAGLAAHALWGGSPDLPCVGASGGISGVVAYYAIVYPSARIALLLRFYIPIYWLKLSVWAILLIYIGLQILGMLLHSGGGVAYLAHIGGLSLGIIAGFAARMRLREVSRL